MPGITNGNRPFPPELLSASVSARVHYFSELVIEHRILLDVRRQLTDIVTKPGGHNIVLVYGPTGVGKTTFIRRTVAHICQQALAEPDFSPGSIPAINVPLWSPENGNFNWVDLYIAINKSLKEPLPEAKIRYDIREIIENDKTVLIKSSALRDVRNGAVKSIHYRNTRYIFLDEGGHLLKIANSRKLRNQMDTIKAFADETEALVIIVGTYDLLKLLQLSGQLDRRTVEINFPRYNITQENDRDTFIKVIHSMQRYLPLDDEPDLVSNVEYVYEKTLGCIGMLKDWFTDALNRVLSDGKQKRLTKAILDKHAPADQRLNTRLDEILEGERTLKLRKSPEQRQLLRAKLELRDSSDGKPTANGNLRHKSTGNALADSLKPGQRNPQRDPVGE